MLCTGEQTIWAGQLLDSLGDTTTSTGYVVSWLQNNLGRLNLSLSTEFSLSGTCIIPDMTTSVSGIYSEMFYCSYFVREANKNLGAAQYSWVEIVGEDQGSIKRANKVESSKVFRTLSQDCKARLDELIKWFNGQQATLCSQILYGERFGGSNFDLLPPPELCSEYNCVWH